MSMTTETELEVLKSVVGKIDQSLDKLTEVNSNISKILAVHETRIDRLEDDKDEFSSDMKTLHKRITESFADLHDKLHAMEDRLDLKYQKQQLNAQNQHDSIQKEIQRDIETLSNRMRSLENWRWWMMGLGVGFGIVIAKVIPMLV
jgi:DNA repair exonuclease SbcCD ATPase subunit